MVLSAGMPNSIPSMVLGLGITVGGNGPWEWPVRPSLDFGLDNLLSIVILLLAQTAVIPCDPILHVVHCFSPSSLLLEVGPYLCASVRW